jgi:glycerol-3-phosphate acyltransferase PlsY
MTTVWFLLTLLAAYLLGSIPTAFLVGRLRGVDIRKEGSGNSGATNTLRVLGRVPAAFVLAVDAAKAVLAVLAVPPFMLWLASQLFALAAGGALSPEQPIPASKAALSPGHVTATLSILGLVRIAAGTASILGHVFPLWLRFRGGKGVATGAAVVFALAPKAALVCLAVFILVVALSRYVSLASICAALLLPVAYSGLYRGEAFSFPLMGFCTAAGILVIAMHRRNIGRLLAGTEHRITP